MKTVATLFIAASLAGSAATIPSPKPTMPVPDSFKNQTAGATLELPREWWKGLHDPLLIELIEKAAHANLDIRKAGSRLAEVAASRGTARSALLPSVDSSTSVGDLRGGFSQGVIRAPGTPGGVQGGSFVSPFETGLVSSGFNMRWELDVFGGLRKSLRAATADAQAADANIHDVTVMVRAEVARNYIEMRAAADQMAIVRANADSERELLDLIRVRADAGLATDLDVQRQVAQLAEVRAALPELDAQRLQAVHRIGVLLGEDPGALRERLEKAGNELQVPAAPVAVPGELLKRRPDLRRAEAQIAAAYARAGAARADFYPKFVITGLTGRQSTDFSGLTLGAGNFFSVGPGITLPIVNFGRIKSNVAAKDAQLQQALRSYEEDVLAAFEETENAFVARDRAEQRRQDLEVGLAAAKRSVELSQELYLRGLADFLTVLDAQRQQFQIERELAATNSAVLRDTVALFKALGE